MTARTLVLATCAAVALLVTSTPKARADYWDHDGWRERHYEHERWEAERRERAWHEREWREHEWREHHRGYGW